MFEMNLEDARQHCLALRELVIHHPGGWNDQETLEKLHALTRAAAAAVIDIQCREQLRAVEECAAELFSAHDHEKWARNQMSGAVYLRLQILRELDSFNARLLEFEASTSAALKNTAGEIPLKNRPR